MYFESESLLEAHDMTLLNLPGHLTLVPFKSVTKKSAAFLYCV